MTFTYQVDGDRNELILDELGEVLGSELELEAVKHLRVEDLLAEALVFRVRSTVLQATASNSWSDTKA